MTTVQLDDGKYKFDIDSNGIMVAARRNDEQWPAGYELRFTGCFMTALLRIQELEKEIFLMTDYIKEVAERAYGAGRTDAFTEMNSRGLSFTNIDQMIDQMIASRRK